MSFPTSANVDTLAFGRTPILGAVQKTRAPASTDVMGPNGIYQIGQVWIDSTNNASYTLSSLTTSSGVLSATWLATGGGSSQLSTLTGDTGTATPSSGNIQIAGGAGIVTSASGAVVTVALAGGSTAMDSFVPDVGTNPVVPTAAGAVTMAGTSNQITTTGGTNTLTFSVPSTFVAPGSAASTTGLTAGTTFTATGGASSFGGGTFTVASGTNAINISADAAATTLNIGTGAGAKTVTIGSTNTTSATNLTAGSGSVNCATDFNLTSVATKITMNGGAATDFIGSATLVNGTVTVANTNIAAADVILVTREGINASTALGVFNTAITASTSFTITALNPTDGTTQTNDVSTVKYVIFRQT